MGEILRSQNRDSSENLELSISNNNTEISEIKIKKEGKGLRVLTPTPNGP